MLIITGRGREELMHELSVDARECGYIPHLIITDIRDFGKINAALGIASDSFLNTIFRKIKEKIPPDSDIFHYSGDKFVIKFSRSSAQASIESAVNAIKLLCSRPIFTSGVTFCLDIRLGHRPSSQSQAPSDAIYELEEVLKQIKLQSSSIADNPSAMQASNVRPLVTASIAKQNLEQIHAVISGLNNGDVIPFVQSIVDANGMVIGYEVLARMMINGAIDYPDNFIPIIRSRGLLAKFTKEIITQSIDCLSLVSDAHPADESGLGVHKFLSFNVDFNTMCDPTFTEFAKTAAQALKDYRYNLKLEVTEDSLADDYDKTSLMFRVYNKNGISISIDDFGTKYSNFHRVTQLDFNEIKIDRSYGLNCNTNPASALFIEFTKKLADLRGADCVVEGVETEEQFATLKTLGLERFQGYLFGRPSELAVILNVQQLRKAKKKIVF